MSPPREPTPEMMRAAIDASLKFDTLAPMYSTEITDIWRAMWDAAPPIEAPAQGALDWNLMAHAMQRIGARGTEEDIAAALRLYGANAPTVNRPMRLREALRALCLHVELNGDTDAERELAADGRAALEVEFALVPTVEALTRVVVGDSTQEPPGSAGSDDDKLHGPYDTVDELLAALRSPVAAPAPTVEAGRGNQAGASSPGDDFKARGQGEFAEYPATPPAEPQGDELVLLRELGRTGTWPQCSDACFRAADTIERLRQEITDTKKAARMVQESAAIGVATAETELSRARAVIAAADKNAERWRFFRDELDILDTLHMIASGTDNYDTTIDAARAEVKP